MLVEKVQALFASRLSRNLGWLGLGQVFMRVSRLGTTVVLARLFSQYDYGLISIVYTAQSFAQVFTMGSLGGGVSAKIVEAQEEDLAVVCDTTYWISWGLCIGVALIQCAVALPVAWFYDAPEIVLPLCVLSLMYLLYPVFKVHSGLIQRENRLKITALGITLREMSNNILTIIFALLGFGVWSVVFGLLFSAPVWIVVNYRNHAWRPPKKFTLEKGKEIWQFGASMMGVEFMDMLRLNIDYLIVGKFLGVEALGLYFLAFNAGLGISKQVINSTMVALFPHLCEVRDDRLKLKQRYRASLRQVGFVIVPLVIVQSSLAPFYVPLIFGEK
ncbi:MAG: oligosaccharide flippase family protein, partial [Cyanobacteria bacterium J06560_2]